MKNILIGSSFLFMMLLPISSFADWNQGQAGHHGNHNYYHYHDHPHWGVQVATFYPDEYYSVWAGGNRYYYDDGIYYNYAGGQYVVAQPPVGVVVGAIPSDFQPVVINGVTYYTNNGTYYVYTPDGYKVVTAPQTTLTVNVPRGNGYVAVILRRSGNGYVGPQGEFYSSFPQVSQLRIMYGK